MVLGRDRPVSLQLRQLSENNVYCDLSHFWSHDGFYVEVDQWCNPLALVSLQRVSAAFKCLRERGIGPISLQFKNNRFQVWLTSMNVFDV